MFNEQVGGQIAWLLPLAGVGLLAGLWLTRRAPRTDRARAGLGALRRVGARPRRRLQLPAGHLPPVLRERAGARGRRAGRRGRRDAVALGGASLGRASWRSTSRSLAHGRRSRCAARPHAGLRAGAAHRRSPCSPASRSSGSVGCASDGSRAAGVARRRRDRAVLAAGRPGRLQRRHRRPPLNGDNVTRRPGERGGGSAARAAVRGGPRPGSRSASPRHRGRAAPPVRRRRPARPRRRRRAAAPAAASLTADHALPT